MRIEIIGEQWLISANGLQRLLAKQVDEFAWDEFTNKFTVRIKGGDNKDFEFLRRNGLKVRRIYWWETITKKIATHVKK